MVKTMVGHLLLVTTIGKYKYFYLFSDKIGI